MDLGDIMGNRILATSWTAKKLISSLIISSYLLAVGITFQNCSNQGMRSISSEQAEYMTTNSNAVTFGKLDTLEDIPLKRHVQLYADPSNRITYEIVVQPQKGKIILFDNRSAEFEYVPNKDVNGTDYFELIAKVDNVNSSVPHRIDIDIAPVNDAPIATESKMTLLEDTMVTGRLTGSDVEGASLSFSLVNAPTKGTLTLNPDGQYTYVPFKDKNGSDSFTFRVSDGELQSVPAMASVTITPVNDLPEIFTNIVVQGIEDFPTTVEFAAIDAERDPLTFEIFSKPAFGSAIVTPGALGDTGIVTYTPPANFNGTVLISVRAKDQEGFSNVGIILIDVKAVNDAPVGTNMNLAVVEDTPVSDKLAATDVEGDKLTYTLEAAPSKGSVVVNLDGSFTYSPFKDLNGNDTFTFRAHDATAASTPAIVSISISPVNDVPVASNSSINTDENVAVTGNLVASDPDGDKLIYQILSQPSKGTLSLNSSTGSYTFTPKMSAVGMDSFTFNVKDSLTVSNTATVTINLSNINDRPIAQTLSFTTDEDTLKSNKLVGTDIDGDTLTYKVITSPQKGSIQNFNSMTGDFVYVPNQNANGPDSFTFAVSDSLLESAPANVNILISPINDAPISVSQTASTNEDTLLEGVLVANDVDNDPLTYQITSQPKNGTVQIFSGNKFVYTPNTNFNGNDSFTFTAKDQFVYSNESSINIVVSPINDPPAVNPLNLVTLEDTVLKSNFTSYDPEGDLIVFKVITAPTHGTIVISGDSFDYIPNANYFGKDSFTVKAFDGKADSTSAALVQIQVTPVNDAPVTESLAFSTLEDTSVSGDFKAADIELDSLTYKIQTLPKNGSIIALNDKSFTYRPNPDFFGTDMFTYQANDGTDNSIAAQVFITVTGVNDVPTAKTFFGKIMKSNTTFSGKISGFDADLDPIVYSVETNGAKGKLSFSSSISGEFLYTVFPDATPGYDKVIIKVSDGLSSSTSEVLITVADMCPSSPFGNGGLATPIIPLSGGKQLRDMAILPDGKLLITGTVYASASSVDSSAFIARVNCNGSLDQSFGVNGVVTFNPNMLDASLLNPTVLYGGSFLVQGTNIYKFNSDGSQDLNFGVNGKTGVVTSFVVEEASEKLYTLESTNSNSLAVRELNLKTGLQNKLFGTNGQAEIPYPSPGYKFGDRIIPVQIALQKSGQIVVGYQITNSTFSGSWVTGITPDGKINPSFGVAFFGLYNFFLSSMKVDSLDRIVLGGYTLTKVVDYNYDFSVVRLLANGASDNPNISEVNIGAYNNLYGTITPSLISDEKMADFVISNNDSIIGTGFYKTTDLSMIPFVKWNSNLTRDVTFGSNGISTIPVSAINWVSSPGGAKILEMPDGKFVTLISSKSMSDNSIYMLRTLANGVLDK